MIVAVAYLTVGAIVILVVHAAMRVAGPRLDELLNRVLLADEQPTRTRAEVAAAARDERAARARLYARTGDVVPLPAGRGEGNVA